MTRKNAGRKRVDIVRAGGQQEARQRIWQIMRELKTFTTSDLEDKTRIKETTIRTYLEGLTNAGYTKKTSSKKVGYYPKSYQAVIWELIKDVGVDAPRVTRGGKVVTQGTAQLNMWRSMKITGEFNYIELGAIASTEEHPVKPSTARDYIKHLYRVGYLIRTQEEKKGNRNTTPARYRFIRAKDTGGKAPMVQRIKQVFDPNIGEVVTPVGRQMVIPESMAPLFLVFVKRSVDAIAQAETAINELDELLETGFRGKEVVVVEKMIKTLNQIESDTDEIQIKIRAELFKIEKDMPPIDVMFIYRIIEWVGELADLAQRVGSRLQLMLAK